MGKGRYLLKRLIYIVFVFFIISILMFFIYKAMPGDPVTMMLGDSKNNMNPEAYLELYNRTRAQLGLDKPLVVQYLIWIGNMLTGDFGYSTQYKQQVIQVIGAPMMNTLMLNALSMVVVFVIAIPLGIATAVHKNTFFDKFVQVITIVGYSLPSFIIALLFIFAFAVKIPIFPISGIRSPGFTGTGTAYVLDTLWHMALPVIVMAISGIGSITRYVRAEMIDVLRMDYIKTARAKGLREKTVIYVHAFRNALVNIVTVIGQSFIGALSGAAVVETVFGVPGLGQLIVNSIGRRDYEVIQAVVLLVALINVLINLLTDLLYGLIDPRIRVS